MIADVLYGVELDSELAGGCRDDLVDGDFVANSEHREWAASTRGFQNDVHGLSAIERSLKLSVTCGVCATVTEAARSMVTSVIEEIRLLRSRHAGNIIPRKP